MQQKLKAVTKFVRQDNKFNVPSTISREPSDTEQESQLKKEKEREVPLSFWPKVYP